ncbi:hypothetical protein WN51_05491 [Melipona quadrifasciata]|uniref:Uncharacterized protein n=1 Tax=Melipona quadrifasciata TaxID=166423 RepID=A0A0M9ABU3_9HYME|nr:hypothetical protein WN51_05491 [Melipona quadrifasciata]
MQLADEDQTRKSTMDDTAREGSSDIDTIDQSLASYVDQFHKLKNDDCKPSAQWKQLYCFNSPPYYAATFKRFANGSHLCICEWNKKRCNIKIYLQQAQLDTKQCKGEYIRMLSDSNDVRVIIDNFQFAELENTRGNNGVTITKQQRINSFSTCQHQENVGDIALYDNKIDTSITADLCANIYTKFAVHFQRQTNGLKLPIQNYQFTLIYERHEISDLTRDQSRWTRLSLNTTWNVAKVAKISLGRRGGGSSTTIFNNTLKSHLRLVTVVSVQNKNINFIVKKNLHLSLLEFVLSMSCCRNSSTDHTLEDSRIKVQSRMSNEDSPLIIISKPQENHLNHQLNTTRQKRKEAIPTHYRHSIQPRIPLKEDSINGRIIDSTENLVSLAFDLPLVVASVCDEFIYDSIYGQTLFSASCIPTVSAIGKSQTMSHQSQPVLRSRKPICTGMALGFRAGWIIVRSEDPRKNYNIRYNTIIITVATRIRWKHNCGTGGKCRRATMKRTKNRTHGHGTELELVQTGERHPIDGTTGVAEEDGRKKEEHGVVITRREVEEQKTGVESRTADRVIAVIFLPSTKLSANEQLVQLEFELQSIGQFYVNIKISTRFLGAFYNNPEIEGDQ